MGLESEGERKLILIFAYFSECEPVFLLF